MAHNLVEIYLSGCQTRFLVAQRPCNIPEIFGELPTKVDKQRAKDAWNAALRLQVLIELWQRFLTCGMLRCQLAAETEQRINERFPELKAFGGVLNLFAEHEATQGESNEARAEVELACGIVRGPNELHKNDVPRTVVKEVQPLLKAFRTHIHTEAACLSGLEVNSDCFRRAGEVIASEITRMTGLDCDWSAEVPILNFVGLLRGGEFLRIVGVWRRALKDFIRVLETYPAVALERPVVLGSAKATRGRGKGKVPKAVAEVKTAEHLRGNPSATSKEIADKIGCSAGLIRGCKSWMWRKTGSKASSKKSEETTGNKKLRAVGLDIAEETRAEEQYLEHEREDNDDGGDSVEKETQGNEVSREEEREQLIREQAKDEHCYRILKKA